MVRKLEEETGEALFDRSTRDGMLTDAGRVLEEYAQKLLNLRREARASLEELVKPGPPWKSFANSSVGRWPLPPMSSPHFTCFQCWRNFGASAP
jgi:DNA-binding transcriptional LysR family regulator